MTFSRALSHICQLVFFLSLSYSSGYLDLFILWNLFYPSQNIHYCNFLFKNKSFCSEEAYFLNIMCHLDTYHLYQQLFLISTTFHRSYLKMLNHLYHKPTKNLIRKIQLKHFNRGFHHTNIDDLILAKKKNPGNKFYLEWSQLISVMKELHLISVKFIMVPAFKTDLLRAWFQRIM